MLRPIAELLDFLENKMSMQAVYQPVVILHLLTRGGVSARKDLARTLSGYDEMGWDYWDRVLMDSPKRALVGKHQILNYDPETQTFSLNFSLTDLDAIKKAQEICEKLIVEWIHRASTDGRLEESEILRHYRVLELAKYEAITELESNFEVDEYGMQIATNYLSQEYPDLKITQQPYGTSGFDIVVGNAPEAFYFVKLKSTQIPIPKFYLSEIDRKFSIDNREKYLLILVYAIDLVQRTHKIKIHKGEIQFNQFIILPISWSVTFPEI